MAKWKVTASGKFVMTIIDVEANTEREAYESAQKIIHAYADDACADLEEYGFDFNKTFSAEVQESNFDAEVSIEVFDFAGTEDDLKEAIDNALNLALTASVSFNSVSEG